MNERQETLNVVSGFLAQFYRQTWNYEQATKNAKAHLGQYPQYKSELSNAFGYLLNDSFSPDTFLTLARQEANYYAIDELDARDFLQDIYIDIKTNQSQNQSQLDIAQLITDLQSDEAQIRSQAAEILGESRAQRATRPLIAILKNHSNPRVRWAAIYALRRLGDLRAVEPLITALKNDADSDVRFAIAYALGQLGDQRAIEPLIAAFSDEAKGVRYTASLALAQLGACTVQPLLALLYQDDDKSNYVEHALRAMNDNLAIYPLLATLKHSDNRMRAYAARFLSHFDDPQVIPPLRDALQDPDSWVRHCVKFSLDLLDTNCTSRR